MDVAQLRPGLWRWTGLHPDWEKDPDAGWDREVGCVYYEAADAVVLVDPLIPPEARGRFLAALDRDVERAGRPVAVLLTVFWHERSSRELADRYAADVWTDERAAHRLEAPPTRTYRGGDTLPGNVVAHDAHGRNECLLWIGEHAALAAGDILHGDGEGGVRLCPQDWLHPHLTPTDVRLALRALLDLPVEMVLTAHGPPVLEDARAALARALEA